MDAKVRMGTGEREESGREQLVPAAASATHQAEVAPAAKRAVAGEDERLAAALNSTLKQQRAQLKQLQVLREQLQQVKSTEAKQTQMRAKRESETREVRSHALIRCAWGALLTVRSTAAATQSVGSGAESVTAVERRSWQRRQISCAGCSRHSDPTTTPATAQSSTAARSSSRTPAAAAAAGWSSARTAAAAAAAVWQTPRAAAATWHAISPLKIRRCGRGWHTAIRMDQAARVRSGAFLVGHRHQGRCERQSSVATIECCRD